MYHNFSNDKNIDDIILIQTESFKDDRGFLCEIYNEKIFQDYNIPLIVQEKVAYSKYGVLRGLHFQKDPYAQGKLVRCSVGAIFDIAVDIRPNSLTFGQWVGHVLSEDNNLMMYIPPGFAHGVLSISNNGSLFHYFTTTHYSKSHESGIMWQDPKLNIQLPISHNDVILSDKDKELPNFESI